jgi:hypothetical protein
MTGALPSQPLRSPHWKRLVLHVYPSFPVAIQLPQSLETWRINNPQAVLILRSLCHHRPRRRTYGGDVSSPVGQAGITLSASVAREERSSSGGPGRMGRIMNGELVSQIMIRPSIPDHNHRHRRVNRDFCHIHQCHRTKMSLFRWTTGLSGCMPCRLSKPKRAFARGDTVLLIGVFGSSCLCILNH